MRNTVVKAKVASFGVFHCLRFITIFRIMLMYSAIPNLGFLVRTLKRENDGCKGRTSTGDLLVEAHAQTHLITTSTVELYVELGQ